MSSSMTRITSMSVSAGLEISEIGYGWVLGNVSIVLWVRKVDFVLERVCFKGDCFWIDMG